MTGFRRTADLPILTLAGAPRERGRVHGENFRGLIHDWNARWRDDIGSDTGQKPDAYIRDLVQANGFASAAERHAPDLLEEVAGLAEGAAVDYQTMFAHQLADEDWWFRLFHRPGTPGQRGEACSALALWESDSGKTLLAQNMDTPAFWDGFQVLLRIRDAAGLETLVFTVAGTIALCGLNHRGVGVCCNTLLQCDHSPHGLPVAFVVRGVLARTTREAAAAFVRQVPHASGQNYLIGGPDGATDLEASAGEVCEYAPCPGAGRVFHTNHPLVNGNQAMMRQRLAAMPPAQREAFLVRSTTLERFATLQAGLGPASDWRLDGDGVKALLSTPPVCVEKSATRITLGCAVMDLSSRPRLELAPGPPNATDFRVHTFGEALHGG
jgi:hypothetical protein